MSLLGTKIKPFKCHAFKNGKFFEISDQDILGSWSIFFFYPADFTFICPTELEDLSNYYEKFKSIGVNIYSISTDTHFSHKVWFDISDTIKRLKFTMISDQSWVLTRNFCVMKKFIENNEEKELGLSERGTFLINKNGFIKFFEITSDGVGRSSSELYRKVLASIYVEENKKGEVCPAKWNEGENTLIPSIELVGKI